MKKPNRTTKEAQLFFESKNCVLLEEYMNNKTPMEFVCSCGHTSKIAFTDFVRGTRCGYCSPKGRKKKYTLEEVRIFFNECGCELLDDYTDNYTPIRFRCKCGAIFNTNFKRFKKVKMCHECRYKNQKIHSKLYEKISYKYRKSLRRTLKALNLNKLDYSHKLLGYTARELQRHLEKHPNWHKVKNTSWHLDHVFPVKAFAEHGIKDIRLINCLDNLQPLSQKENNQKCDTYDKEKFQIWLKGKI